MDDLALADHLLDAIAKAFQEGKTGEPRHPGSPLEIRQFIAGMISNRQDDTLLCRSAAVEVDARMAIELLRRLHELRELRAECHRLEVANCEFADRLQRAHQAYNDPGIEKPRTAERDHAACVELGISGSRRRAQSRLNRRLLDEYEALIGVPDIPGNDQRWEAIRKLSVKYELSEEVLWTRLKSELRRRRGAGARIPAILPRD